MIFTVTAERDLASSPEDVFAAWLDPARRARFETPEGSGMRLATLDTREGGHEEVAIGPQGDETGRMPTDIRVLRPPADGAPGLLVVHGTGVFGGVVAMAMQTVVTVRGAGRGRPPDRHVADRGAGRAADRRAGARGMGGDAGPLRRRPVGASVMAGIYGAAGRVMGMSGPVWLRHANPWSVWTRILTPLPLLIATAWSRVWIGWWAAVPLALVIAWIWINPRAFSAPSEYGGWAQRAVLGERIWLGRDRFDRPAHHARVPHVATALAAAGGAAMLWGLAVLDPWAAGLGALLAVAGKAWFCDRMVWLHADVTGIAPGAPMARPIPFDLNMGETT